MPSGFMFRLTLAPRTYHGCDGLQDPVLGAVGVSTNVRQVIYCSTPAPVKCARNLARRRSVKEGYHATRPDFDALLQ